MQQTNIGLGGKTVVAGLDWAVIAKAGTGRKKAIHKACVDSGLTLGVLVDGPENAAVGLCTKKADFPSGAAMLAAAHGAYLKDRAFGDTKTGGNWILVEKIQSGDKAGMYWLCAVQEGLPIPGGDLIGEQTVTTAKLAELVEVLENVEIYSTVAEILEYVAGAADAFPKGFVELTDGVPVGKSLRPQKLVGVPDWVFMAIFAIFFLILAVVAWSWWSEEQAKDAKRKQDAAMKNQRAANEQQEAMRRTREYQEQDARARDVELQRVAAALSKSPKAVFRAWAQAINSLPINHGGWIMENVACSLTSCTVALARDEAVGTAASLKEIVPSVQFSEAGGASYSIPVIVEGQRSVAMGSLVTWPQFALTVGTSLQQMKMSGLVEASLGARKEVTYRPPPLPAQAGPAGATGAAIANAVGGGQQSGPAPQPLKSLGLVSGPIQVRGNAIWQLDHVGEYVDSTEFTVESLKVEFGRTLTGESAWTVTGSYYLQAEALGPQGGGGGRPRGPGAVGGQLPPGAGPQPPANQPLPMGAAQTRK